ncbi:MAG: polysaccharide biosynthesis/export family protein [Vicinamibacterales bacterium]
MKKLLTIGTVVLLGSFASGGFLRAYALALGPRTAAEGVLDCGQPLARQAPPVTPPQTAGQGVSLRAEYKIGPQDVISVTVFNESELSGKFTVEADGSFTFPLLGRVTAAGLTPRGLENQLQERLGKEFLRNPRVSVSVQEYRSKKVFIVGEVRSPGPYQLTANMTVLEAIAHAGSTTVNAADEVLIVRPAESGGAAPVMPEQDDSAQVIKVNIAAVQAGDLSQNALLEDGDTVVVPRALSVYVFGHVNSPGAYNVEKGMTVMQALALAGGLTDRGTDRGLRIIRVIDGKKKEISVKLSDLVQPGDTIMVKQRIF